MTKVCVVWRPWKAALGCAAFVFIPKRERWIISSFSWRIAMKLKDKLNESRDLQHFFRDKGREKNICLNRCCSQLAWIPRLCHRNCLGSLPIDYRQFFKYLHLKAVLPINNNEKNKVIVKGRTGVRKTFHIKYSAEDFKRKFLKSTQLYQRLSWMKLTAVLKTTRNVCQFVDWSAI